MLKLATGYIDAGQAAIGRQVINLLHGALVLSASYARVSIMETCEAVRRNTASYSCRWSASSLYEAEFHVLLNPIVSKGPMSSSRDRSGKRRREYGPSSSQSTELASSRSSEKGKSFDSSDPSSS